MKTPAAHLPQENVRGKKRVSKTRENNNRDTMQQQGVMNTDDHILKIR